MNAQWAIQDFHDLLVELVTNSDDAYHEQFDDREILADGGQVFVDVERHKGDKPSVITVRDRAGGFRNLLAKLKGMGEKTSRPGARGFMARGLKDCAALGTVIVETIVDDRVEKAEIIQGPKLVPWSAGGRRPRVASEADRVRLGIPRGGGTVVRVELRPEIPVPVEETLCRELPWHFALRDIARAEGPSTILLKTGPDKRPIPIVHQTPANEVMCDEEYVVPGYPGIRARFRLLKTSEPLSDPLDSRFRRTGILVKGRRGVYACSFFSKALESDIASERFLGRLECGGIDQMLEEWDSRRERAEIHPPQNPMMVIDPNRRGGLNMDHPFVRALLTTPTEWLKAEFEKEKEQRRKQHRQVEARETTERLRRLAKEASRFIHEKLEGLDTVSTGDVVRDKSFVQKGIALVPAYTQIPVG